MPAQAATSEGKSFQSSTLGADCLGGSPPSTGTTATISASWWPLASFTGWSTRSPAEAASARASATHAPASATPTAPPLIGKIDLNVDYLALPTATHVLIFVLQESSSIFETSLQLMVHARHC
ncbi:hypothetical protein MRX96_050373 [Rhipicephalus microplus]